MQGSTFDAAVLTKNEALAEAYRGAAKKVLKNWNGMVVGKVKAVGELG
jgi:L-asparaginase II